MRNALEQLKRQAAPYLGWAGKAERTSFEIDTVSLHVHERIDPASILNAVRKRMKGEKQAQPKMQLGLFSAPFENLPLRDAIDFYKHDKGWSNRLIAGDSLLVMNSLLQREGMAGQVQMIYMDPPYGITYGSNFQPFTNKRDVRDRNDEDLSQEPETLKAFRDTWELGVHSYLAYLRDRLLLAHDLLSPSGSVFVQISDENVHHVRELLDEVFGAQNFFAQICYRTSVPLKSTGLGGVYDIILWYAKDITQARYNQLYAQREEGEKSRYSGFEEPSGKRAGLTSVDVLPPGSRVWSLMDLASSGYTPTCIFDFPYRGQVHSTSSGKSWKTNTRGMGVLARANRISDSGKTIRYVLYLDDYRRQRRFAPRLAVGEQVAVRKCLLELGLAPGTGLLELFQHVDQRKLAFPRLICLRHDDSAWRDPIAARCHKDNPIATVRRPGPVFLLMEVFTDEGDQHA